MTPTHCALSIHTLCDACHHAIQINAPRATADCDYCGATKDVTSILAHAFEELWTNDWERFAKGRHYSLGRDGQLVLGGQVDIWAQAPTCEGCQTLLPVPAPGTSATLECPGCALPYETYPVPAPYLETAPYLRQIISMERTDTPTAWASAHDAERAQEPVLTGCPKCGATLTVTETLERATACQYCASEILVPDAVWRHLHPVRKKHTWFVELVPDAKRPPADDSTRWPETDTDRAALEAHRAWIGSAPSAASSRPEDAVFGRFQVEAVCPSCGETLPVNGPLHAAVCGQCLCAVDTSRRIGNWIREFEYSSCAQPRKERRCHFGGGVLNGTCWAQVGAPTCGCGAELPRVAPGFDGQVTCPGCGRLHEAFPAPAWLGDHCLSPVQCYGGERGLDLWQQRHAPEEGRPSLSALALPPAPVTFDCLGCGGSLTVTGAAGRICTCSYCTRHVFLPDAVWLRLFPPKVRESWFLQLGGPLISDPAEARRIGDEAEQREVRRPALEAQAAEERQRQALLRRQILLGGVIGGLALAAVVLAMILR